jgi:hypothetical protein
MPARNYGDPDRPTPNKAGDVDAPALAHLAIAAFAPAHVDEGARFVLEVRIRNEGLCSHAVDVYIRCNGASIERFCCPTAKTSVGRFHGSFVLDLPADREATVAAMIGPVTRRVVVIRADAVWDEGSIGVTATTTATPPVAGRCEYAAGEDRRRP